ncbi:dihydropteroate synthase [Allomuricauda sp. d1]|uniref:dihydropteroate synthase n=1 Tax=Allomuricauda sp. d1 TaxID=3136725 RepID=UPI0031D03CA8
MGILNLTPDSFYDGGRFRHESSILKQVEKMLADGADFIDIGGYSSRPGADFVAETEELKRLTSVLEAVVKNFPETLISVDTFRSKVADSCLEIGASMINDISGGDSDKMMMDVVAKHQVPYIIMHMRGNPQTMQKRTEYDNVVTDVMKALSEKVRLARSKKINDLIIDPGFGFAKTLQQNYDLLGKLQLFKNFESPILVGLSRKSMVYKMLETAPEHALNGTSVLHTVALLKGVHILRVHDVKEAVECIRLVSEINTNSTLQGLH